MEATTVRSGSSRRINFVVRVDEDWTYGNWRFEHYQHMIQRAPYERFMDRLGGTIALVIRGAFLITVLAAELAWVLGP